MPRISQLPSLTAADNSDEIAIVDVSSSTTKKITRGDLLKAPLPANSVTTAAIQDGAVKAQNVDFATLSTTGKLVGVTDDGKNIYERVFNGNMTAAAGSRLVTTITFAGITGIINASGYITTSSGRILALGQTWHDAGGTNEASGSAVFYDSGTISIITRSDMARSNSPYKLVLRYTNA